MRWCRRASKFTAAKLATRHNEPAKGVRTSAASVNTACELDGTAGAAEAESPAVTNRGATACNRRGNDSD